MTKDIKMDNHEISFKILDQLEKDYIECKEKYLSYLDKFENIVSAKRNRLNGAAEYPFWGLNPYSRDIHHVVPLEINSAAPEKPEPVPITISIPEFSPVQPAKKRQGKKKDKAKLTIKERAINILKNQNSPLTCLEIYNKMVEAGLPQNGKRKYNVVYSALLQNKNIFANRNSYWYLRENENKIDWSKLDLCDSRKLNSISIADYVYNILKENARYMSPYEIEEEVCKIPGLKKPTNPLSYIRSILSTNPKFMKFGAASYGLFEWANKDKK